MGFSQSQHQISTLRGYPERTVKVPRQDKEDQLPGHRGTSPAGSGIRRLPVLSLQGWKTSDSRISRYVRTSNFEEFEARKPRGAKTLKLVSLWSSKTSLNFIVSLISKSLYFWVFELRNL